MSESIAFSPIQIGPMHVINRFVRTATGERLSNKDGTPQKGLLNLTEKFSKGRVGLIIPGFVYPMEGSQLTPGQTGMVTEKHSLPWRETIKRIHKRGSKIIFQLGHAGIRAYDGLQRGPWDGFSACKHQLTIPEIEEIIEGHVKSAKQAKNAGADGVQLHGAHGFLLSLFMSPAANQRQDKYGGSTENRVRIVKEIAEEMRKEIGTDFMIGLKLNGEDFVEGGVDKYLCAENIHFLQHCIDLFEISCGFGKRDTKEIPLNEWENHVKKGFVPMENMFNLEYAKYAKEVNPHATIMTVGGVRSLKDAEFAINSCKMSMVGMCRPFIREPLLLNQWYSGNKTTSDCKSCNQCMDFLRKGTLKCGYP